MLDMPAAFRIYETVWRARFQSPSKSQLSLHRFEYSYLLSSDFKFMISLQFEHHEKGNFAAILPVGRALE